MGRCSNPRAFGKLGAHCRKMVEIRHDFLPKDGTNGTRPEWLQQAFKWQPDPVESFVVDLPGSLDLADCLERLRLLKEAGWLDFKTSHVSIEYSVWNPQVQRHIVAEFNMWPEPSGIVVSKYHMATIPWAEWSQNRNDEFSLSDISFDNVAVWILCLLCLRYMMETFYQVCKRMRQDSRAFLSDLSGIVDACSSLMLFGVLSIRVYHIYRQDTMPIDAESASFIDCGQLMRLYTTEMLGFGTIVFVSWLKLLTFLRLVPVLGPHSMALFTALLNTQILVFFLFFCLVTLALALGVHVAFGSSLKGYSTAAASYFSAFQAMLGDVDLEELQGVHYLSGTILFFLITIVFSQFVTSTFISVISSSYQETVMKSEESWQESINNFMATHVSRRHEIELGKDDLKLPLTFGSDPDVGQEVATDVASDDVELAKAKAAWKPKAWHWAPSLPKDYAQAVDNGTTWPVEEDQMDKLLATVEAAMQVPAGAALEIRDKSSSDEMSFQASPLSATPGGLLGSEESSGRILGVLAELNERVLGLERERRPAPTLGLGAAAAALGRARSPSPLVPQGVAGPAASPSSPKSLKAIAKRLSPGAWCNSSRSSVPTLPPRAGESR